MFVTLPFESVQVTIKSQDCEDIFLTSNGITQNKNNTKLKTPKNQSTIKRNNKKEKQQPEQHLCKIKS